MDRDVRETGGLPPRPPIVRTLHRMQQGVPLQFFRRAPKRSMAEQIATTDRHQFDVEKFVVSHALLGNVPDLHGKIDVLGIETDRARRRRYL